MSADDWGVDSLYSPPWERRTALAESATASTVSCRRCMMVCARKDGSLRKVRFACWTEYGCVTPGGLNESVSGMIGVSMASDRHTSRSWIARTALGPRGKPSSGLPWGRMTKPAGARRTVPLLPVCGVNGEWAGAKNSTVRRRAASRADSLSASDTLSSSGGTHRRGLLPRPSKYRPGPWRDLCDGSLVRSATLAYLTTSRRPKASKAGLERYTTPSSDSTPWGTSHLSSSFGWLWRDLE